MTKSRKLRTIAKFGLTPILFLLCGTTIWQAAIADGFSRWAIIRVSLVTFIFVVVVLASVMAWRETN
ncbi:MAG: hypothetical protein MI923_01930 [Phycisphaerales bacterium]|nr:hypothetical protein [Phycisphaerales bacterium]